MSKIALHSINTCSLIALGFTFLRLNNAVVLFNEHYGS